MKRRPRQEIVVTGGPFAGHALAPGDRFWLFPLGQAPYYPSGQPMRVPAELVAIPDRLDGLFRLRMRGTGIVAPLDYLEFAEPGPGSLPDWEGPTEPLTLTFPHWPPRPCQREPHLRGRESETVKGDPL